MALLTQTEVYELINALVGSGLNTNASRGALFQSINPRFVAGLETGHPPAAQLLGDIGRMNQVERFSNGDVPLEIWLRNADLLLGAAGEAEQKVVRSMLNRVTQRASGAPPVDPGNIPETKERIIHRDDMVTFAFMQAGVRAGASVVKLHVPRFEDGQARTTNGNPVTYLGTGWLLSKALLMTNHHVINARNDGEPAAADADLRLQGGGTRVQFDFDGDDLPGIDIIAQKLEAWDATLDYAVLRIGDSDRPPLRRAAKRIEKSGDATPVNIIQHPGGRSKRYGIRNNLVSASTATELRYFTDTDGGSSGSPVFNDRWEVVALHRASTYIEDVQFQGKRTAYVNVGTQLSSIIEHLQARSPALAAEI